MGSEKAAIGGHFISSDPLFGHCEADEFVRVRTTARASSE